MPGPVANLLNTSQIELNLNLPSEIEAIPAVALLLSGNPAMLNPLVFREEVMAREKISPTAAGRGVAFPHARSESVSGIVMAAGRSLEGIPFQSCGKKVHLIFVIGTPPEMVPEYLALMGALVRLLKTSGVRERLMGAVTPGDFISALG